MGAAEPEGSAPRAARAPDGQVLMRRLGAILSLLAVDFAATAVPGGPVRPVAAAEYTLETMAAYDVRPDAGQIGVAIEMTLTNTTPDPDGQFSVFSEVKLAIHDGATAVTASDGDGELDVSVKVENDV